MLLTSNLIAYKSFSARIAQGDFDELNKYYNKHNDEQNYFR